MPGRRISPELSEELRVAATPIFKAKGVILFRAGQPGRGAFVVRSGQVKMILDGAANFYPTRILGSGALIGLPAAVSGEPYSLTAEATKDCRLDYITRRKLLNLLRRNTKIACQIVKILSEEIFQMRETAKLASQRQHSALKCKEPKPAPHSLGSSTPIFGRTH